MDYSIRVACYERVSTEEQSKHGLSIDAQISALGRWVTDQHHILVGHYTDAGVSGGKPIDKRPAMWRLLQDIQAGLVDLVIFTKLDRWFRSLKNYYKAQEILDGSHCAWQAIDEDYETLTASGRFKVNIMFRSPSRNESGPVRGSKSYLTTSVQRENFVPDRVQPHTATLSRTSTWPSIRPRHRWSGRHSTTSCPA